MEKYHQTVSKALEVIATSTDDNIPTEVKLNFFNEARHAYGRTALMLSGQTWDKMNIRSGAERTAAFTSMVEI